MRHGLAHDCSADLAICIPGPAPGMAFLGKLRQAFRSSPGSGLLLHLDPGNSETATEDPATLLRAHRRGCGCGQIALRLRSGRRLKPELKSKYSIPRHDLSFHLAHPYGTTATRCFLTALPQLYGREMGRPWEGEERCKKVRLDEPGVDPLLRLRPSLTFSRIRAVVPSPCKKEP